MAKTATSTAKPASRAKAAVRKRSVRRTVLLVATRKGAWLLHGDASRRSWRIDGPHFLGHVIHHLVLDARDGRTLLAAARTGTSARPSSARPTSAAHGRKLPGRRRSRRSRRQRPNRRSHLLADAGARE